MNTIPLPTLGGSQLWSDVRVRDGYRIQRHAITGHHRLIDRWALRHFAGSLPDALRLLDQLAPRDDNDSVPRIILLHGLMRSSLSMRYLSNQIRDAEIGVPVPVDYASTRGSIDAAAATVAEVIADLPPTAPLAFVGHSMGNIVTRRLIRTWADAADPVLDRCRAMVMLGPPNQGAAIARRLDLVGRFGGIGLFETFIGRGAVELGTDWQTLVETLATPPFPFEIIAGRMPGVATHPLVDGPGDLVVSLTEAALPGAAGFHEVAVPHSTLMLNRSVVALTLTILATHVQRHSSPNEII